jgi:ribosomal protein L16 Arg81 hydroxylase
VGEEGERRWIIGEKQDNCIDWRCGFKMDTRIEFEYEMFMKQNMWRGECM